MESDFNGKAALLAAVSALGLSLGVAIPASAAPDDHPTVQGTAKSGAVQDKGGSSQIKFYNSQIKGDAQIQDDSRSSGGQKVTGESRQNKLSGPNQQPGPASQQIKGESRQKKLRSVNVQTQAGSQ